MITDEEALALYRFSRMWGRYWKRNLLDDCGPPRVRSERNKPLYALVDRFGERWLYSSACLEAVVRGKALAAKEREARAAVRP